MVAVFEDDTAVVADACAIVDDIRFVDIFAVDNVVVCCVDFRPRVSLTRRRSPAAFLRHRGRYARTDAQRDRRVSSCAHFRF